MILTVTDVNGNVSTADAVITVEDNVAPIAITQPVTVQLDANGNGSITAEQVNNGSSDGWGDPMPGAWMKRIARAGKATGDDVMGRFC